VDLPVVVAAAGLPDGIAADADRAVPASVALLCTATTLEAMAPVTRSVPAETVVPLDRLPVPLMASSPRSA